MILCTANAEPLSYNHFHWLRETIPFKILLHFRQGIHGGRIQSVSMVFGGLQKQLLVSKRRGWTEKELGIKLLEGPL